MAGAANVTVAPLTGLLLASFTMTARDRAKAVLMGAVCEEPSVTAMVAGGPAWLVRVKPVDTDPTVAVNV